MSFFTLLSSFLLTRTFKHHRAGTLSKNFGITWAFQIDNSTKQRSFLGWIHIQYTRYLYVVGHMFVTNMKAICETLRGTQGTTIRDCNSCSWCGLFDPVAKIRAAFIQVPSNQVSNTVKIHGNPNIFFSAVLLATCELVLSQTAKRVFPIPPAAKLGYMNLSKSTLIHCKAYW